MSKLLTFVREHLADSVEVEQEGLVFSYRLKADAVPSLSLVGVPAAPPAPSAIDLFRIWKSPNTPTRIAVRRDDGTPRALARDEEVGPGEVTLCTPSRASHDGVARVFIDEVVPEAYREEFAEKINHDDPRWWMAWDDLFRRPELSPLRGAWLKHRGEALQQQLRDELLKVGLDEVARARAFEQIMGSSSNRRTSPRGRAGSEALRRALLDVIERLPEGDLRNVWVPAGMLFDALQRRD
ncbi:MAG: hypothetical protein U0326_25915 [Polyangiales bacterium]